MGKLHRVLFSYIYRISVWEDEKVPMMYGDNGCSTMKICLMPLDYTLKNIVKMIDVMFYIFYHIKK